ncbi:MAG: hypothetical protein IH901_06200 [Proteobacteria bacterium]|nr:hypothetical protein [Pseudomonadota bacterium]
MNFVQEIRDAIKRYCDEGLDDVVVTAKPAKVTGVNLFQQPEAHPTVLDLVLLRKYGPEWLTWEPETLAWRIPQDFRSSGVSDLNMHKIQAMKTLHFNDDYWMQWEVFNWCLQPFNNQYPNFDILQVPSTAQIAVAVSTAADVRGDAHWSDEVEQFMRSVCRFDGIFYPRKPLAFLGVGTENSVIDHATIDERWPKVKRTGKMPGGSTIVDEQLRRMLEVNTFLSDNRQRLQSQMALVLNE